MILPDMVKVGVGSWWSGEGSTDIEIQECIWTLGGLYEVDASELELKIPEALLAPLLCRNTTSKSMSALGPDSVLWI